ncbi:Glycine--tRNA ligase beta subunit [Candidatus Cyrtobacter comes]|uniref:glycine--tRNA ligase n=2 Tax=Candidatus Cyrtobacter comes TaxID=675776 RepID=A0ABU5L8Z2_9RICK|nr:Glycine--tRNA ligase beta subunit [Candidatus Cyrtobacter comes]
MKELLLEIYSEEVPALAQEKGAQTLFSSIVDRLKDKAGVVVSGMFYHTPTRIVIVLNNLPDTIQKKDEMIKGPKVQAPQAHISAFMKKHSISLIDELEIVEGFYYIKKANSEDCLKTELANIIVDSLKDIVWPKSMNWAGYSLKWIRPLKNILCLLQGDIVDLQFGHIKSNNITFGHKFLSNRSIEVISFSDYASKLRNNFVEFDQLKRRSKILDELYNFAEDNNLKLIEDEALIAEIVGITEYPSVLCGEIERRYMLLPEEILIASLKNHQKIFMFRNADGLLASFFAHVINTEYNEEIMHNTKKVITARLNDAEFFFNQDLKKGLDSNISEIKRMVFHEKIGSVYEKSESTKLLAGLIAKQLDLDTQKVDRAAQLAKLDLATEVVGEFPELQGIMGCIYAIHQGEDHEVALAIKEHYMPRGRSDVLPETLIGAVLAMADRLDTLCHMFRIGIKPTGSKDPYALRRAAIGFIRIEEKFSLNIGLESFGILEEVIEFINSKRDMS